MIAYIQGDILSINESSTTILTESGIGYEILINDISFAKLSSKKNTSLYVHHHITENNQLLFGFTSLEEKKVFIELIKISGVGGKVGLLILSLGINRLSEAIAMKDNKTIESIKGIGKKMAEKIILELKDKDFIIAGVAEQTSATKNNSNLDINTKKEIIDTLTNMGYNRDLISRTLNQLPEGYENIDEIIPYIIKNI